MFIDYDRDQVFPKITQLIESTPVVVFMKGDAHAPMCGFSNVVVRILEEYDVAFEAINVMSDPIIRQAIKDYTDWPTIPQIFINGTFIGGCDILQELHASGDLVTLLQEIN